MSIILSELCRTCCVIFVQEHWLLPNNLDCLSNLDDNFTAVASSAMDDVLGKGVLRGRPFGGVAILGDNKLMNNFKLLHKSERLIAVKIKNCLFINICFPVNAGNSNAYDDMLLGIIGNIENIINDYNDCNVILGGDFNLQFVGELSGRVIFNDFVKSSGLKLCDSKLIGPTRFTYLSEGNNCKSFIDHFFVDGALFEKVQSAEIIDSGMNLSDHLPLLLQFSDSLLDTRAREVHKNGKSWRIRCILTAAVLCWLGFLLVPGLGWTEFCVRLPVLLGGCPSFHPSLPTCVVYSIGCLYLSGYSIASLQWSPVVSLAAPPLTAATSAAQCRFWLHVGCCVLLRGVSFWSLVPIWLLCSERPFLLWVHQHGMISPLSCVPC